MNKIAIISKTLTILLFTSLGVATLLLLIVMVNKIEEKTSCPAPSEKQVSENYFGSIKEEMPRFPGCEQIPDTRERNQCAQRKMLEYFYKEFTYPATAREQGITGTVVVRFYIDEKGRVKSPEILRGVGGGFDEEVVRVIKTMNDLPARWIPGKQRGRAVKVYYTLPVKVHLK